MTPNDDLPHESEVMGHHSKLALGLGVLLAFSELILGDQGFDVFRPVLGVIHAILSVEKVHLKHENHRDGDPPDLEPVCIDRLDLIRILFLQGNHLSEVFHLKIFNNHK